MFSTAYGSYGSYASPYYGAGVHPYAYAAAAYSPAASVQATGLGYGGQSMVTMNGQGGLFGGGLFGGGGLLSMLTAPFRWLASLFGGLFNRGSHPQAAYVPGVSDIGQMAPSVYRGTEPSHQGLQGLRQAGVGTVLDLDNHYDQSKTNTAAQLGLQHLSLPVQGSGPPTLDQALTFLNVVTNPANGSVYVHGDGSEADRTGVMSAVYRVAHDGLSADQAIALEHNQYGFNGWGGKSDFVHQFAAYWGQLHPAMKMRILHLG